MPDSVLLFYYLPRNTFLDKKSEESSTGIVKAKYKLLFKHHKEIGVFIFFVLTTEKSACVKERTLSIFSSDWDHREGSHLNADCSYIDVQKCIVMEKKDVLEKAGNPNVGFSYAGKVVQSKFVELTSILEGYMSSATTRTDFKVRDMLKELLLDSNAENLVKKLNI